LAAITEIAGDVFVKINGSETKDFPGISIRCCPVLSALLWMRLIRMIKVDIVWA